MNSFIYGTSSEAVEGLLDLVKAPSPIVDLTYGNGTFWKGSRRSIIGCDLAVDRARDCVANFMQLPFADASIPTVVFDPPFHPSGARSAEEARFKSMGQTDSDMKVAFLLGVTEAWRVTKSVLLVKCQGFIHNHRPQWMPLWAVSVCGEPFEWLMVGRDHKRISGRWVLSNSLRHNHAEYLVFKKAGNYR